MVFSQGTQFVGNSIQHYVLGDLVLLGPNWSYYWVDDPREKGVQSAELMVIQSNRDSFSEGFSSLAEAKWITWMLDMAEIGLHFDPTVPLPAGKLMSQALGKHGSERLLKLLETLGLLVDTPFMFFLASADYLVNSNINRERREILLNYVRKNLAHTISQANYC